MFKSVYEFTKVFSVLFFLTGTFFLFKEMFILAFLTMASFFIIKFIDSDWAFDNFKFGNHNLVVICITFSLIFINVFAIYQELRFSPFVTRIKTKDKESYLLFENALYSSVQPCTEYHNKLMARLSLGNPVYSSDIENANTTCYKVINDIDKQVVPGNLSKELTFLCTDLKDEFKKMTINLASYNYSLDDTQKPLILRVKGNLNSIIKDIFKIREIMRIQEELEEEKKAFILL